MSKKKEKITIRVGIDFGKTIGLVEEEVPYKDSYSVINFLIRYYGKENIFIVSKARTEMKQKINNWLVKNKFFKLTNFEKNNLIFCDNYEDKVNIVKKHKINVFIDDHYKVIHGISELDQMIKVIWFNQDVDLKLISKKYRMKVVFSNKWAKLIKVFHKINKKYF